MEDLTLVFQNQVHQFADNRKTKYALGKPNIRCILLLKGEDIKYCKSNLRDPLAWGSKTIG